MKKLLLALFSFWLICTFPLITLAQTVDKEPPSEVENLRALPGEKKVKLTWSKATDAVGVTGYRIYSGLTSVTSENNTYDRPVVEVGVVTEYEINNLDNGITYFFALTAIDAAGNESQFYSNEAKAVPTPANQTPPDYDPPTDVEKVATEGLDSAIYLSWEKSSDNVGVTGYKIYMGTSSVSKPEDSYNLPTIELKEDVSSYKVEKLTNDKTYYFALTALDANKNESLNYSDEVSATPKKAEAKKEEQPKEEVITVEDDNKDTPAEDDNKDTPAEDDNKDTPVEDDNKDTPAEDDNKDTPVEDDNKDTPVEDDNKDTPAEDDNKDTPVEDDNKDTPVEDDEHGSAIEDSTSDNSDSEKPAADTAPPENVTNLAGAVNGETVTLTWKISSNTAKDLATQILYTSKDKGQTFSSGIPLDVTISSYTINNLEKGQTYVFKITTKDGEGNESTGLNSEVKIEGGQTAPKSGPELLFLLIPFSLSAGYFLSKKK